MRLIRLGYWREEGDPSWPDPGEFIDPGWDADERIWVTEYLRGGMTASAMWGFARCRLCGQPNGCRELTDGLYVWPEGLAHYVGTHGVRLPESFVDHAKSTAAALAAADIDSAWWRQQPAG